MATAHPRAMATAKRAPLKRRQRRKRIALALVAVAICATGLLLTGWLSLALALLAWVVYETWLSDRWFYAPGQDYRFTFPEGSECIAFHLTDDGTLLPANRAALTATDTLVAAIEVWANPSGWIFDPAVRLESGTERDTQVFERGAHGMRYLNLTGFAEAIGNGSLRIGARYCRVARAGQLWIFRHPEYLRKRVLVIAPHADDAEIAAFGLYGQAAESWILTLTAGEVQADHYRRMGLDPVAAARLKGRLRAWDSLVVPRWAGVPSRRCFQLGYFCLQLEAMRAAPDQPIPSREAGLADTRPFRRLNELPLPGDADGSPTWERLKDDLRYLIEKIRPQVIVLPHPVLDPHPDHVCTHAVTWEALAETPWQPEALLGYANHLHNQDRWPFGDAHTGVPLPPRFAGEACGSPYSLVLAPERQWDKAMALGMMHDLRPPPPWKKRLRRFLQRLLLRRTWPPYGANEYFRRAVRRHELFWSLESSPAASPSRPGQVEGPR